MKKQNNILVAFWLNLVFALVELVGAFFTNSVAIASDAIHDLGDSLSIGISWYLEKFSDRERDIRFSFGYKRFSLLGALINCLILIFGSLFILRETIPRIWQPQAIHTDGMLWLAIIGIAFNGFAAFKLHHGHSINESVLSLHFLEDVLGWVAVLVVAIVMQFWDFPILDPILALLVAAWVIWNASKRLRQTLRIFLQSTPDELDMAAIDRLIQQHPEVTSVHDTRAWSLDGRHHVLSTHLMMAPQLSNAALTDLKCAIRKELGDFGFQHVTLEIENEGDACNEL
ncbi:MAG: cation diffusion facilitator family transporter [Myxococcota bacterium]